MTAKVNMILVAIIILPALASPCFARDGDWEYWQYFSVTGKFDKKNSLGYIKKFNFKNDMSKLYLHYDELQYNHKLNNTFQLGFGLRNLYRQQADNSWAQETWSRFLGKVNWKMGKFKLMDRNIFEYRSIPTADNWVCYRNMLKAGYPVTRNFRPFVANEIFVGLNGRGLWKNEINAGFDWELSRAFKTSVFYIYQTRKPKVDWVQANILEARLKFKF